MFLDTVLREYVKEPVTMLDLCAAPGGKSTVARAALPEGSLLVSNEPIRKRAQILVENLQKFGHPDVIVTNNYPRDYSSSGLLFDVILADVPCSGEGMFRKDTEAIGEWSWHHVEQCWRLQREIVTQAWDCLRPGGLLIYSTCTFNALEDEENVRFIQEEFDAEVLTVPVDPSWNIMGSLVKDFAGPIYRFLPGLSKGEGLFMAVLRKKGTESARTSQKTKEGKRKRSPLEDTAREWLLHSERYDILQLGEKLTAIPKTWKDFYCRVLKSLQVMHAGITIGEIRGKDLVPNQSLALSVERHPQAFPAVELTVEEAIGYLRREPLPGMSDQPRGYVVVSCMGLALGFLKNLGTRTNNLYPQEWRIKSSYIDTPCLNIHRTI
jgi:NOL1/NOP2/fmu family ribosome biogenesis protein/23S rRNA U2552 (ribose-2'-O)-methylase RlmE/FtsJ